MDFSAPPPPPYREVDSHPSPRNNSNQFRVARKPVYPERPKTAPSNNHNTPPIYFEEFERLKQARLQTPLSPTQFPPPHDLSLNTNIPANLTDSQLYNSSSCLTPISSGASPSNGLHALPIRHSSSNVSLNSAAKSSQSSALSYIQQAFREARHFAGGLITHPTETTKHFTILRHSHGLVFYQGANTSLAISIFADQPLPPDRTIWLQSKGWSGKTGMRARAFMGRNGNWINVTPTLSVSTEQLKQSDERAWQRDIAHFRKKPKNHKQQYHILRETAIIRIPEEAEDGYFQFVLCLGDKQKVLCPSPVFRILSASANPSSIRGASLTTLPLELGVIAFGTYARNTAGRVVGPVATVVQNRVQKLMPSWITQQAASAAYGVLKPSEKIAENSTSRNDPAFAAGAGELVLEEGPRTPYPLRFMSNSEPAKIGVEQFNIPAMELTGIPLDITQYLLGYYLGWARFVKKPMNGSSSIGGEDTWYSAVISVLPMASLPPPNKNVVIRLTRDYEDWSSERRVIEVRIMGLIRPNDPLERDALQRGLKSGDEEAADAVMLAEMNDILFAENVLDHPAWNPEAVPQLRDHPGTSSGQTIRMAAQRQIGKVPFHKFGVRSPVDGVRDTLVAANGYYIRR